MSKITTIWTYQLNGVQTEFAVNFDYLSRKFVKVTLIGKNRKVLRMNVDYRFISTKAIKTTKAWGSSDGYTYLEIRRVTSATDPIVDFSDGSILRAGDLTIANLQAIHVAEEARSNVSESLGITEEGELDARNKRIIRLGSPINSGDAVNKEYVDTAAEGVIDSRDKAKQYSEEAKQYSEEAKLTLKEAGPITHVNKESARAMNNPYKLGVKTLDNPHLLYKKTDDSSLYVTYPECLKFTDKIGTKFIAVIPDVVSTAILGKNEDEVISDELQFLLLNSNRVILDKNYMLRNHVYLVSNTTLDLNGHTLSATSDNVRMILGARQDNEKGGYTATQKAYIINGTLDRKGMSSERTEGTIMSIYHCYDIHITNVNFLNVKNDHSIEISGCSNVYINDCTFKGYIKTVRTDVEHIQIENMTDSNSSPAYGPYDNTITKNVHVKGCVFGDLEDKHKIGAAIGNHYEASGINNIHFIGNQVMKCYLAGVRLIGGMSDIFIRNNSFLKCTALVIHAAEKSPYNVYFKENNGIGVIDILSKNKYTEFIRIDGTSAQPARNINVIDNTFKEIEMSGTTTNFIRFEEALEMFVHNNVIENVGKGIMILKAASVEIDSNTIKNAASNFVLFDQDSKGVMITNNHLSINKSDSGIYCRGVKGLLIDGNTIKECDNKAITLTEDTSYFRITNNFIQNFGKLGGDTSGIVVVVGHEGSVYNNKFQGVNKARYSIDISNLARNVTTYNNLLERGSDGYIKHSVGSSMTLSSPNGSLYKVTINDSGELKASLIGK